jgi:hypothetical protein
MSEQIAKDLMLLDGDDLQRMLVAAAKLRDEYTRPDSAMGRDAVQNRVWAAIYAELAALFAAERDARAKFRGDYDRYGYLLKDR